MISVITTLFNYKKYIADAIDSFLIQDIKDSEMIIVDDASTDNPYNVIKKYASDRVKYIRLDENKGYSNAKNIGIKSAKGEILVMLDADDMLTKGSLSIRYKKMKEGYDLVHGPALDLDNKQQSKSKLWNKWIKSDKGPKAYKCIHAQTVMLKKDIHRKIGLYDTKLRYKSDREMWARVMCRQNIFRVGYVDQCVCIYRIHDQQMHKSKAKMLINEALQKEVERIVAVRTTDLSGLEMLK